MEYNGLAVFEKIKKYQSHPLFAQFKDIRVVGFAVFGVLVLLVSWSGVRVIETNYVLQKQVAEIEQENKVAELENTNLRLQNEYYNTDHYLELQARKQFGKGLPGETLLLVPESVALAHTVDTAAAKTSQPAKEASDKPLYQRNLEAWRDFFTHSQAPED